MCILRNTDSKYSIIHNFPVLHNSHVEFVEDKTIIQLPVFSHIITCQLKLLLFAGVFSDLAKNITSGAYEGVGGGEGQMGAGGGQQLLLKHEGTNCAQQQWAMELPATSEGQVGALLQLWTSRNNYITQPLNQSTPSNTTDLTGPGKGLLEKQTQLSITVLYQHIDSA